MSAVIIIIFVNSYFKSEGLMLFLRIFVSNFSFESQAKRSLLFVLIYLLMLHTGGHTVISLLIADADNSYVFEEL